MPTGPSTDAPVALLKTWKPSLTICTYWVAPTSPLVSGGAQLQATPGNPMPLKFRSGLGMLTVMRLVKAVKLFWTTVSGLSLCLLGIFGFSLACSAFDNAGWGFISRSGFEVKPQPALSKAEQDRKSTRLNSSHQIISYAVFCLKKK